MRGIKLLRQAADTLVSLDPDSLTDDELRAALIDWQRQEARLVAAKAKVTMALDRRHAYRHDGSKTAAAWLARQTHIPLPQARAETRFGRRLALMPRVQAALEASEITQRHAEVLGGLADSPRRAVAQQFTEAEEQLLGFARELPFEDFVLAVHQWECYVDQDGPEQKAQSDHESRHLHLSQTFRGNWRIDGQLDVIGGTEVAEALRRIEDELFKSDWAEAKAIHGDDTRKEHLARTARQRRADALQEMARRSVSAPADGQEPRPLIVVHVGAESLKRLCELSIGTPVTPGQLVPLITDADLERIVYEGESRRIVDLGTRSRLFTGPLRRAIELRDRRCTHPGCRVPAELCEIDHDKPVALGGRTDQDNGKAKCGSHNRHKGATHPDHYPGHDPPLAGDPGYDPPLDDTG